MMPPPHGKGGKANEEVLGEFYGIIKSYNPEKGWKCRLEMCVGHGVFTEFEL